jgi:copper(I)-binding protein
MKHGKAIGISIAIALVTVAAVLIWVMTMPSSTPSAPTEKSHLAELYKNEPIKVDYAYAFATPDGAKNGAVFLVIYNQANTQDFLIKTESKVARHTEIHESYIDPDDQTMMMRKVDKIEIPEGYDQILVPDGYHIMLIDLFRGLEKGEKFTIDLTFEKAGKINVPVVVTPPGERLEPNDYPDGMADQPEDFHDHSHGEEPPTETPKDVPPVFLKETP